MSNQYPPPGPPQGYGTPYGEPYGGPQGNNPLAAPPGGPGPASKTSIGLDGNVAGMLSYLGNILCCLGVILSLVFLITEKENRFVRFHAAQSLLLSGVFIITLIVLSLFSAILGLTRIWILVLVVGFGLRLIVGVIFLIIYVLAGIKAYQGTTYKLPLIGDMAEKMTGPQ
ncbi:MAG TPA: DUF4870 domain-containing protein [Pyrinomonadaceae bacterium]|jgi:uncharacterized membrane protein